MRILLIVFILIMLFFITKSMFVFIFSMQNYNIHKKRLKQLKFQKKENMDVSELIDAVTKPVTTYILPKLKPRNMEQLEIDLKMAKWDKFFTPIQYRSLSLTLKFIGVFSFIILYSKALPMAILWSVALIFGIDFLFNNSKKNRKAKLMSDFPDFIRITEGYLLANIPFAQAVSESIKYVGEEWKPILQGFVVDCEIKSVGEALETLKKEVDTFEVREFVALVRLALDQGGDAKDSFSAQADKIREMQMDLIAIKIGRRQMMGIFIQAPLLICNIMVIGLPTISAMINLTSM